MNQSIRAFIFLALFAGTMLAVSEESLGNPLLLCEWHHDAIHGLVRKWETTNAEFHDDSNPGVVMGQVVGLGGGGAIPIANFRVKVTVTNDSGEKWNDCIIAFEFAQHPELQGAGRHWVSEGYDPPWPGGAHGPQPVINPSAIRPMYSVFNIKGRPGGLIKGQFPDVPAIRLGPFSKKQSRSIELEFTIDAGGAQPGSPLFMYLTSANTRPDGLESKPLRDIFWARRESGGISNYPEPLASDKLGVGRTCFDPTAKVLGGWRIPENKSNVSVFVLVSKKVYKNLRSDATPVEFDPTAPTSPTLAITPTYIKSMHLVDDPENPLYSSDFLQGADFIVEGLVLEDSIEDTHFFTNGQLRIEKAGIVYLQGDLNLFVAANFPPEPKFPHSYAVIENLSFPQGTGVSQWLADVESDLAADDSLTLNFALEPTEPMSLAETISDSLASGTPAITSVVLECYISAAPESLTVARNWQLYE